MYRAILLMSVVVAAGLAGCVHDFEGPAGFVEADAGFQFVKRVVSADGLVIGLRTEDNPEDGTLTFWTIAIRNELADGRGYELLDEEAVVADNGEPGTLMDFAAKQGLAEMRYMTAVYVVGDKVLVAEAGGKADAFAAQEGAIRDSLLSVK